MTQLAIDPLQLDIPFLNQCSALFDENFGVFSEMTLDKNHLMGRTCYIAITRMRDTRLLGAQSAMGQGGSFSRARACSRALGEAVERTSSATRKRPGDLFGTYDELKEKHTLIDPITFPRRKRDALLPDGMRNISRNSMLAWTQAVDLASGKQVHIPSVYAFMPHMRRREEDWVEFAFSSGLAGGASREAANLSGILELAERDAFSLTWLFKRETGALPSDVTARLEQRFPALQHGVVLHNISNDLGIPAVLAVYLGNSPELPRLAMGAAAELTFEAAAEKALEELAGCMHFGRKLLIGKAKPIASPEDIKNFHDHAQYWIHHSEPEIIDWLSRPGKAIIHNEKFSNAAEIVAAWAKKNRQVYCVDLTIPEYESLGLYVSRVVVPSLQPLWVMNGLEHLESPRITELGLHDAKSNPYPHPFP